MKSPDLFRYEGKRALVVGGATGMGAAVAELARDLGADVTVMDYAPISIPGAKAVKLNLAEKASINEALNAAQGRFDALFMCAGVADGTPGIERINFIGHRYLIDQLIAADRIPRGGAICFISSSAGLGWEANFAEISKTLDTTDFEAAAELMRSQGKANYMGTKQAVCAYVAREAMAFLQRGVRLNAICPGPTDTPLAQANKEQWLGGGSDYREAAGIQASTPMEQAYPTVFLCSDAAKAITGVTLVSDVGWLNAGFMNVFPPAKPFAEFLLGRQAPQI